MENEWVNRIKSNWLYILIGLLFVIYLIARAIILPVTIDESGTIFNAAARSFWGIVSYEDPVPNNHIINTLLIKLLINIFGLHSFIVRLPNILGFILYYSIIVIWMKRITNNKIFILFGIIVLTCNHFLIDFFSLARGYALSISFMFTALYFMYCYFLENKNRYLNISFLFAAFGMYTNFTLLNFYVCFLFLTIIILIQQNWNNTLKKFIGNFAYIFLITLTLTLISWEPIRKMVATDQLKYWNSNGLFQDTLVPLANSMQYGQPYFGFTSEFYASIFIIFTIIIGIFAILKLIRNRFHFVSSFFVFSFLVLAGVIIIIILQFHLLHTPFLNARGAIFLYVLFGISFILFIHEFFQRNYRLKHLFIFPFIILGLYHFGRTVNFYSCREWYFDANTKKVLNYLEK